MEPESIEIVPSDDRFCVCVNYPPDNILFDSIQFGANFVPFADVEWTAIYESTNLRICRRFRFE